MKFIKETISSLKKRPIWTLYVLMLAPFFYLSVFFASLLIAAINLNVEDGFNFWSDSI